ncbi:MAG: glutamine amidotransferase [Myxococcota bacterium]
MIDWLLGGALSAGGRLAWQTSELWIVVAIVAALIVWLAASVGPRPLSSRAGELGALAIALAGLVFAIARPVWIEEEGRQEPGRVAVLVDSSRSMAVMENGAPRSAAVDGILRHIERQAPDDAVDFYHFGDDLVVGPTQTFDLPGTDLEGALEALSERVAGEQLAGVVVVTDGLDRGLLRQRFRREDKPAPPVVPGPLTVFETGEVTEVVDLAVRSVDTGGFAFIRAPFQIEASLQGIGFEGRTIPVSLTRDGALITETSVTFDKSGEGKVTFEVVAEAAGRFAYAVTAPVYEGDAVPANNTMPVVVRVVRDRIRVLQVAGAPSWDVKFLRRFLKGDPSVQLVSFFILRTQRDPVSQYREHELSLIQFPYERLFDEDLWTFDVVVFQNFDYGPYFSGRSTRLLGNLERYVKDGGALVMLGGDRSFGLGGYGDTPLADILPVEISSLDAEPDLSPFRPALSEEGARHPVTRLVAEPTENAQWWDRLHPLDGTNVVQRAKSDAAVLLTHPTARDTDGQPLPVLAVREVGKGRSMALTVDASWRWSLSEAAEGRGNQTYLRFWKNAIRWLMKDSTTARVTVDTPRENYAVGEDVRIVVRARDPGFAPMPNAEVALTINNEGKSSEFQGQTNRDGEVVIAVPAERSGTHRVSVKVAREGKAVGDANTVFAVTTRDPEVDEVAPDSSFLVWLAAATDGVHHAPGDFGSLKLDPDAGRMVQDVREVPIWRAPLLGLIVCIAATFAWFIRRRSGLR